MDGYVKETAVNNTFGHGMTAPTHTAGAKRAPLPIRVALIIASVLFAVACVFAAVNLAALTQYNQATQTLNGNIRQAQDPSTDLNTLLVSQQQTDTQFGEANALRAALLPSLRDAINANAAVSSTLTERIQTQISAQSGDSQNSNDVSGGQSGDGMNESGLTDAQKQQIEDLLRNNQTSNNGETTDTSKTDEKNSDSSQNSSDQAKPW